jgi:argininosuccinate lyase
MKKPWSARFSESLDRDVLEFTSSIPIDKALYPYDIQGSLAHVRMLHRVGLMTKEERDRLSEALKGLLWDVEAGRFAFSMEQEDVHMALEEELTKRMGELAHKLHTARSRNDQVALDLALFLKEATQSILALLKKYRIQLLRYAYPHTETPMPAFTHNRPAQNITLAHYLLAFYEMARKDEVRFERALDILKACPIGSGALAGSGLPIDRFFEAATLGFDRPSANSLETVSNRDALLDFLYAIASGFIGLSRFAEDLILFSSPAYGFFVFPDRYCTGSSLMPHKKNPDVLELIRGRAALAISGLSGLMILFKGLPMGYNRDMQEDKRYLFGVYPAYEESLRLMTTMIGGMEVQKDRLMAMASDPYLGCVDLVEFLIKKGMAFRKAYELIGQIVKAAETLPYGIKGLGLEGLKRFSELFDESALELLSPQAQLKARVSYGSPSIRGLRHQLETAACYEGIALF